MEDPSTSNLLPAALRSQKDVLFGNMPEIYQFHSRQDTHTHAHTRMCAHTCTQSSKTSSHADHLFSLFRVFLQDLQRCLETPEKVGSCFLQRVRKPRRENSGELCCRHGRCGSHLADLTGTFFCVRAEGEVPGVRALLPEQASLGAAVETVLRLSLLPGTSKPLPRLKYLLCEVARFELCFLNILPVDFIFFFFLSFFEGVPEEAGSQAGPRLLPPQTSPASH